MTRECRKLHLFSLAPSKLHDFTGDTMALSKISSLIEDQSIIVFSEDISHALYQEKVDLFNHAQKIKLFAEPGHYHSVWDDFNGFIFFRNSPAFDLNFKKALSLLALHFDVETRIADINAVTTSLEYQLDKLKFLHRNTSRLRTQAHRGFTIKSKYSSGLSPGGAFFEVFEMKGLVYLICTETDSYRLSSSIISLIEKLSLLKEGISVEAVSENLSEIHGAIREKASDPLPSFDAIAIQIDPKKMEFEGITTGQFDFGLTMSDPLVTRLNAKWIKITGKLCRGEKIMIFSPGLLKNTHTLGNAENYHTDLIKSNIEVDDAIHEIYYQLKKKLDANDYLDNDSLCVVLEVGNNAVFEA